jgi:hypothetical protein
MNAYDWLAIIAAVGTVSGFFIRKWLLHHIEYSVKLRYQKELETHKANLQRDFDVQLERLKAELAEKHFRFSHVFENWRVVPSCRFVESEFIDIAAAVEADFGSEEFLEDYAFG